ncbi:TylF/MycF family methyltransferase [bacterium]|nr:TylF/MycF family methyltransferase [bacterium]
MIELPDFKKCFEHENGFYLTTDVTRLGKVLAHYELFMMVNELPGAVVECGVFKGASIARFATFRHLFSIAQSKKIIGFDTFGTFPETMFEDDKKDRDRFIGAAGDQSISEEQMMTVLKHKKCDENVELVKGDICLTVPEYVKKHPELRISLLNLDTDIYEPSVTILEYLYPRIVKGGILILDDYAEWPGETKAVDDYFKDQNVIIQKFPFCQFPSYIIKE